MTEGQQSKNSSQEKQTPVEAPKAKSSNKTVFWVLGVCCGCGCLIVVVLLLMIFGGLLKWNFWASADVPSPNFSVTNSAVASVSSVPSTEYPEAQDCTQIDSPPSVALGISTDNPGLKRNIENHYYKIYGSSKNQITRQMSQCGPKTEEGSWGGLTNYNINWRYNYSPAAGACGITDVTVGLQIDMYLPEWEQPNSFAPGLDNSWNNYISALTIHENGHRDDDIKGAEKILATLNNLGTYSSCDEAGSVANARGYDLMDELKATGINYDASTNHGETQGAVLQ